MVDKEIFEKAIESLDRGEDVVLATVVKANGPTPGKEGFKMLIVEDSIYGSIGGGELEKMVIERSRKLEKTELIEVKLEDIGMRCGGEMAVFLEHITQGDELHIFGGGNIAFYLSRIAKGIGFRPIVYDYKEEVKVEGAMIRPYPELLRAIPSLDLGQKYVVVATDSHEKDYGLARAILGGEMPLYLGIIGSEVKAREIKDRLKGDGIPLSKIDEIHCPIGLVKSKAAAEIAVSIAAELIKVRNER
jgi:xanthine dehydrogenase accessory factor